MAYAIRLPAMFDLAFLTCRLHHSLTHSLTPSLPPSLPHSPAHSLTSLHFTSFHFTHSPPHSLTYIIIIITIIIIIITITIIIIIIIIIMCQRCLPATGHAERDHKMCGCARKSAEHYFGQRKYGEHTIRAWWNSMKAKQLTHKQLTLRTYIHRYLNTYIPTYLPTYIPPSSLHHSYPSSSLLAFCAPSKSVSSLRSMPSSLPNGSA